MVTNLPETSRTIGAFEAATQQERACFVRLGQNILAIESTFMRQVVDFSVVTSIPRSAPLLSGLIAVRNEVLPLFSLHTVLGSELHLQRPTLATLVQQNEERLALAIDQVIGFTPFDHSAMLPLGSSQVFQDNNFGLGILRQDDQEILVLNIPEIISYYRKHLIII